MRRLFDTSVAVALREGSDPILDRAERLDSTPLLSILSVIELEGGMPLAPEGAMTRRQTLDELYATLTIVEFGLKEARAYRQIIEALGFSCRLVIDRMIASQAIVARATLATLNPRDFRSIPGLNVEDWS